MTKQELIKQAVKLFKGTLNPQSKWYNQDMTDYYNRIQFASVEQIKTSINNMSYAGSKKVDSDVKREIAKLEQAGMFDVKSMKPINQLN